MWLSLTMYIFWVHHDGYMCFGHDRVKGFNVPLPRVEALPMLYELCTILLL